MQAIVMIFALCTVVICGTAAAGGFGAVMENTRNIPGFLEFFGIAKPEIVGDVQQVSGSTALFGAAGEYGALTVISTTAWGLGYFGMPQVLLRFMAIRRPQELKKSRRIAVVWVLISLAAAVFIGIIGRALYPTALLTAGASENIFIVLSTNLLPPLIAGIVMAGILAATISSSDSYLLIAASALSKNIYQGIAKKNATDKQVMVLSRITLVVISVVGVLIALDEKSVIFTIVSFAWAGFGATFGPILIFSLFWKRINRPGAIAGMIGGAATVFIWKLLLKPLGGVWGIYELLPAFIVSCVLIVAVSLLTKAPSQELNADFKAAKAYKGA
jgi:sodium/proline symporter